jgi:NAD(P)-dependent dehydrogenase (short-subunit alcohol dehydrogenase family)
MQNVLITGANRGLGLEFTKQYSEAGCKVIACCRNPESAERLQALALFSKGQIQIIGLNVSVIDEIKELGQRLKDTHIDILINNAGSFGGKQTLAEIDYQSWSETLKTNTFAPVAIAQALKENLIAGSRKLIVNITSKMGSIDDNKSGSYYIYRSSKVALNMVTKSLAVDLQKEGITVIAIHPGWVKTDMGGKGASIQADESIQGMRKVIEDVCLADSGQFLDFKGQVIEW